MLPSLNFNPSFPNLTALHSLGGPTPGPMPMSGMPLQTTMPMQYPQNNLGNLRALMQMFGQR